MSSNKFSTEFPEYTWRAAQPENAPALFQFLLDIDAADGRTWAGTLADTENEFNDPTVNIDTDTLVGFTHDGRVAANAWIYAPPEPGEEYRAFLWIDIHPDHRRNDLGDYVLQWAETRAQQILAERPFDRPHVMSAGCMNFEQYRRDLLERHGFSIVRHFFTMRRDLSQAIDEVTLPEGLALQTWHPDLDQRMFEAFNEAFSDHWGHIPASKEVWDLYITGRESYRPDLSFVILDGEQVAGISLNFLSAEENERHCIQEAWIGDLAVRRPWRKRGLATALLNQSMQAFKDAGMDYATLGVDTQNSNGALGIYQRVGFKTVKQSMAYWKEAQIPEGSDSISLALPQSLSVA